MASQLHPDLVQPITHVVFDMDGLLLDTERLYSVAQDVVLQRYGLSFSWELKVLMMGKRAKEAAQALLAATGLEGRGVTPEEFLKQRDELLAEMFPRADLMPGAERLIRHLHDHNIPIAVATSTHKHHFSLKTRRHTALFSLFHHIVTGDDPQVLKGKPAPDIFQVAAARFEPLPESPHRVLVFEDAPLGVDAGRAADMWVVMVPDSHIEPALRSAASSVIDSLLFFNPKDWGLPPFKDAPANITAPAAPVATATASATALAAAPIAATFAAPASSSSSSTTLPQVQVELGSVVTPA